MFGRLFRGRLLFLLFGVAIGAFLGSSITYTLSAACNELRPYNKRDMIGSETRIIDMKDIMNKTQKPQNFPVHTSVPSSGSSSSSSSSSSLSNENSLTIALLPSEDSTPASINAAAMTWGRTVPQLVIFVDDSTETLSVPPGVTVNRQLKLPKLNNHPTTLEMLQILRYLHDTHFNSSDWFFLASDKVYINYYSFQDFLDSLPSDTSYVGSSSLKISSAFTYCSSNGGVLLSRKALKKIISVYETCIKWAPAIYSWDKGLGKCYAEVMTGGCHSGLDSFFLQDDTRIPLVDLLNKEDSILTNAFSLYPISSVERMYSIHYYYATIEYKKYSLKADTAGSMMMDACQELPHGLLQEDIVQIGCDLVRGDDQSILDDQKNLIKYRRTTRYRPINHYQYRNWHYFDTNNLYNDETTEPHHHVGLFKYLSREYRRATDQATKEINKKYAPKRYKLRTIINGFVKNDPIFGNDYIIDGKFIDVKHTKSAIYERVRIFQPIQNGYTLKPSKNDASELINIIVPISDVTQRCYDYLEMFEKIYSRDDKLRLVLVVFGENDVHDIQEKINEIRQTTPKVNVAIVKGKGNFSRAQALDQGMMTLDKNDLAFLCDVDMEVNITFFDRCRRNTNQGKMVYYPEVFKMYNSRFLTPDKNSRRKHSRFRGHWGGYAFGMLCIYKSDYTKVGGLNTKMMGWGGEDVDLFQKVLKSRIEVLRAPDVGLIHRWHKRSCSKTSLTESNYKQCLSSRAEALGDKRPLGHFLYLLQDMYPDLKQKLQIPV